MSTRRYATVVYGYSLPCDFEVVKKIDPDWTGKANGLDVHADGMSGSYFLIGKTLVDYPMDSYETEGNDGVVQIVLSFTDKADIKKKLVAMFPDHKGPMGAFYVTRYV